jgi:rubrerythrin
MSGAVGCKVDEVIRRYGLQDVDPTAGSLETGLLARWRGEGDREAMGYRTLTDWFNKRLLKRVYADNGQEPLGPRLAADYETLRSDDELAKQELLDRLDAAGVPAEALADAMVSWGTMRTHLTDCLGGEKPAAPAETDWERESIEMARAVTERKAATALSALAEKEAVDGAAAADIEVQVHLTCGTCPTRVPFAVALDRGYVCGAHSDPPSPVPDP